MKTLSSDRVVRPWRPETRTRELSVPLPLGVVCDGIGNRCRGDVYPHDRNFQPTGFPTPSSRSPAGSLHHVLCRILSVTE